MQAECPSVSNYLKHWVLEGLQIAEFLLPILECLLTFKRHLGDGTGSKIMPLTDDSCTRLKIVLGTALESWHSCNKV